MPAELTGTLGHGTWANTGSLYARLVFSPTGTIALMFSDLADFDIEITVLLILTSNPQDRTTKLKQ